MKNKFRTIIEIDKLAQVLTCIYWIIIFHAHIETMTMRHIGKYYKLKQRKLISKYKIQFISILLTIALLAQPIDIQGLIFDF